MLYPKMISVKIAITPKERPYLVKIGRESLGFKSSLDWPEGGWQKGSTTTLLMEAGQYFELIF